jgi:hypothetical protein
VDGVVEAPHRMERAVPRHGGIERHEQLEGPGGLSARRPSHQAGGCVGAELRDGLLHEPGGHLGACPHQHEVVVLLDRRRPVPGIGAGTDGADDVDVEPVDRERAEGREQRGRVPRTVDHHGERPTAQRHDEVHRAATESGSSVISHRPRSVRIPPKGSRGVPGWTSKRTARWRWSYTCIEVSSLTAADRS